MYADLYEAGSLVLDDWNAVCVLAARLRESMDSVFMVLYGRCRRDVLLSVYARQKCMVLGMWSVSCMQVQSMCRDGSANYKVLLIQSAFHSF